MKQQEVKEYSQDEMESLEKYIEQSFGPIENIIHEKISNGFHLDVAVVGPTKELDCYKLVTMGMGVYEMNIPMELDKNDWGRCELILLLPKEWKIMNEKKEWFWPIEWLRMIAKTPIRENSWVGFGHTFGNGEKFADNTEFSSIALLSGCNQNMELMELKMENKQINFYQMLPMYEEELQYKQQFGLKKLLDLFDDEVFPPIVDIHRKNYSRSALRNKDKDFQRYS